MRNIIEIAQHKLKKRLHQPHLEMVCVELTDNCNLSCEFCSAKTRPDRGFMQPELFYKTTNEVAKLNPDLFLMSYAGESLLHPNFTEFLKYAASMRKHGLNKIGWFDNLTLFDKSITDLVLDLNVDVLCLSINGVGPVEERIMKGSKYTTVEENLNYLLDKRGESKLPVINLIIVDYGRTQIETTQLMKAWQRADNIILSPYVDNRKITDNYFRNFPKETLPYCPSPFMEIAVRWDGKVTCCAGDYKFELDLGSTTIETATEIWNGPKYAKLRNLVRHHAQCGPCNNCTYWQLQFKNNLRQLQDGWTLTLSERNKVYKHVRA